MKYIKLSALILIVLFSLVSFSSGLANLSNAPHIPLFVYRPGQKADKNFKCYPAGGVYNFPPHYAFFCAYGQNFQSDITVTTDENMLIKTSYMFTGYDGIKLGDLINAWGSPERIYRGFDSYELYWPDRFAFSINNNFSPDAVIYFIALGKDEMPSTKWRGFSSF